MSTRSIIALQTESGKNDFRRVFAHWDGYPSRRMKLLTGHYHMIERTQALLSLGDISSLHELLPGEVDMTNIKTHPNMILVGLEMVNFLRKISQHIWVCVVKKMRIKQRLVLN